ncbi:uncharacterized protein EI97DRAFT_381575 [Westerdykella ornata]|uniref:ML-like domain-containing protein n=1 Tax=Westerdykella ornata TaxID=318751 RepID=A0A6A6JEG1_WESOR|nr:uncharacterized protein EI97DRAFT_381575 [Westerdykella ornata]KAF2274388.1 hypothetical protein EI97DRAFT_381575 [Westerdykella ornata]
MASVRQLGCAQLRASRDNTKRDDIPSLQPPLPRPRPRRRPANDRSALVFLLLVISFTALVPLAQAVFVDFSNCLDPNYRDSNNPKRLQFTPLHVWASFNTTAPSHHLNITVWGNVSGQAVQGSYPPPDDSSWSDVNSNFGKIVNLDKDNNKLSTLFSNYKVLTYTAHNDPPREFCPSVVNQQCPLGPAFNASPTDLEDLWKLPAFQVGHDFHSTYSFATLESTMRIVSGSRLAETLGCVSTNITPDLGPNLSNALRYLPAAVLALVAFATIFAATCSPWGTWDVFRWSSNYGRDEDLLRLVTPGFGDCLQYIQFIVLAGSLNLQYPGFYQPVVSQASWSVLLFNESLVSHGNGTQSLVDGIYVANGTYGLTRLGQYVGMSEEQDIWAGMAVWLLGVIAIATLLVQIGFFGQWLYHVFSDKSGDRVRGKNWAFSAGNVVRIVFNFFMLPIISLSLFQLVVAARSPASVVATAVVLLVAVMGIAAWIFWFIFTTRPRAHLFDDLPTVLTYGPLYNTYSDDAAPFAFIPVLLTVIRGVAIGAIQPSGIAQIIVLAICEVILILTVHAFRPFQSNTSMNAYHTFFSVVRLTSTLLLIAFVPSLGVTESRKGWFGYVILLMHAIVLVFGFFLNALQTIIEVTARLCGAGDERGGLTKVFGKRQLSRRNRRRRQRSSLNSDAAMLGQDADKQTIQLMSGRTRSMSGSSGVLLGQPHGGAGSQRASVGYDQYSQGGDVSYSATTPGTPATATPWSQLGGGSGPSSRRPTMGGVEAGEFYRAPRPRKHTLDSMNPVTIAARDGSTDLDNTPYADNIEQAETGDGGEGPSSWSPSRSSITPAYLRMQKDESDPALAERRKNTDYSVRESDFYYGLGGLRGPALSDQPTRKLKTGPADPTSPVSSAAGWLKSLHLFGGKKKEKGKGFEVVRGTRMPPQMMMPLDEEEDEAHAMPQEPYRDHPGSPQQRGDREGVLAGRRMSDDSHPIGEESPGHRNNRISDVAPSLGPIDTGRGIELPSRIGSRASRSHAPVPERAPTLPRKSSRRTRSTEAAVLERSSRLSAVVDTSGPDQLLHPNQGAMPLRLPFGSTEPSPSPERTPGSSLYHDGRISPGDDLEPPPGVPGSGERPLSTGYVQQHVASDSIQNDQARTHLETSAEFVDRSRSISTHRSGTSNRTR